MAICNVHGRQGLLKVQGWKRQDLRPAPGRTCKLTARRYEVPCMVCAKARTHTTVMSRATFLHAASDLVTLPLALAPTNYSCYLSEEAWCYVR